MQVLCVRFLEAIFSCVPYPPVVPLLGNCVLTSVSSPDPGHKLRDLVGHLR